MLMSGQVFLNLGWFDRPAAAAGGCRGGGSGWLWRGRGDGRVGLPQPQPGGQPHALDQPRLPARPDQPEARPPEHVPRLAERLVRPNPRRLRRRAALRAALGVLELLGPDQMGLSPPVPRPARARQLLRDARHRPARLHPLRPGVLGDVAAMRIPLDGLAEPLPDERSLL